MPLYLYFSFLLCLWLGFANVLCLFLTFFIFSTLPESRFCQCSMPLYLIFFLFFCACFLVLPMFYASLLIFFLLMRLFLSFAYVLCLFIYIFLFFCVFGSILPMLYYLHLYFSFIYFLCLGFANILCPFIIFFLFFCVCVIV